MSSPSEILAYHEATKHSPTSVASSTHRLDWSNKPLPFKVYHGLDAVDPPADIARLCRLSNGVLRWRRSGGESQGFRAAACTGALYHVELYLATAAREDLPAGLYHYGAHDHRLRTLREGDVRAALQRAAGGYEPIASAPLVFVLTSTFWRNSWKYQARAYRHAWWDSGAVVANLLALLGADKLPASVVMGFADEDVSDLLGIDGLREVATSIVVAGHRAADPPPIPRFDHISPDSEPLSPREIRYPEIETAHRASSLSGNAGAAGWRAQFREASHEIPHPAIDGQIEEVIERRRSARRFGDHPLSRAQLEGLLATATMPIPGDSFVPLPVEPMLIVNAVDGLAAGAYDAQLRMIHRGDFRRTAAELALWQELAAEAGANVFFLADVRSAVERLGERAYGVAQLAGGIGGERLELAATDAGLRATGLTFFDDAVTQFFEPAAAGRQVMYLAAMGSHPGT